MTTPTELIALSDSELNRTLAELCGWREVDSPQQGFRRVISPDGKVQGSMEPTEIWKLWDFVVPKCATDLNAVAQVEAGLTDEQHKRFRVALWEITTGGNNDGYEEVSNKLRRQFVSALPRQRAEALAIALETK